jgi:hypothetical protein
MWNNGSSSANSRRLWAAVSSAAAHPLARAGSTATLRKGATPSIGHFKSALPDGYFSNQKSQFWVIFGGP